MTNTELHLKAVADFGSAHAQFTSSTVGLSSLTS
jgi:hypothetical protein